MRDAERLLQGLRQLYEKVRANQDITEEELRTHFKDSGFLEILGYFRRIHERNLCNRV